MNFRIQHSWKEDASTGLCGAHLGSGAILLEPHPDFPICPECERGSIFIAMQGSRTLWFLESTMEAQRALFRSRGAAATLPDGVLFEGIR